MSEHERIMERFHQSLRDMEWALANVSLTEKVILIDNALHNAMDEEQAVFYCP